MKTQSNIGLSRFTTPELEHQLNVLLSMDNNGGLLAEQVMNELDKRYEEDEKGEDDEEIEKAAGDRGGKVIGYTKSGKPIYEGGEHHKTMQAYHNFSSSNHIEHAKRIRQNIAKMKRSDQGKESGQQTTIRQRELEKKAKIHEDIAHIKSNQNIQKSSLDILRESTLETIEKGGEGSRGGKVIGYTKSGKPIYQRSDEDNTKNYTVDDHKDASQHHWKLAYSSMGKVFLGGNHEDYDGTRYEHHNKQSKFHDSKLIKKGTEKFNKSSLDIFLESTLETIEKGHKGMIGEIREWQGKKYKKQSNGKWLQVSEKGLTKKEHQERADSHFEGGGHETMGVNYDAVDIHNEAASKLSDKEHSDEEVGVENNSSGKVIGHTKSGKPVYEHGDFKKHYKDFSKEDHADARKLHYDLGNKKAAEAKDYDRKASNAYDRGHEDTYERHGKTAEKLNTQSTHHHIQATNHSSFREYLENNE